MSFEKRGDIHPDRTRPEHEPQAKSAGGRLEVLGDDVTARAARQVAARRGRQEVLGDRLRSARGDD